MNYIGSKYSILSYIDEVIEDFTQLNKNVVFCDIFAGTGVVSKYFKEKGYNIIANDIQFFSYATLKGIVENSEELKFEKLSKRGNSPFIILNGLSGKKGFIYKNYSMGGTKRQEYQRQYFSDENAKKIDACRIKIEKWKNKSIINSNEYYYLIACFT